LAANSRPAIARTYNHFDIAFLDFSHGIRLFGVGERDSATNPDRSRVNERIRQLE
jgi:hypothetical protein